MITSRLVAWLHDGGIPEELLTSIKEQGQFKMFSTTDLTALLGRVETGPADAVVVACEEPSEWVLRALRAVRELDADVPCLLFSATSTLPSETVALDLTAVVERTDDAARDASTLVRRIDDAVADHHASLARERERERRSALLSTSPDVVVAVESDGQVEYASPAVTSLLGYDPDELVGTDYLSYVHANDRERLRTQLRRLVDAPDDDHSEAVRLRHAEGAWVWVEHRGRNLLDHSAVHAVALFGRGVTERLHRETRFRRYESIVEHMHDVAYTVDESLTLTYANERALEYAESTREAVVGQSIVDLSEQMLTDSDEAARFLDALRAIIDGTSDFEQLELGLDMPGGRVVAEIRATPMELADTPTGELPREVVVISRDITDRFEYEQALERQNERLDTFSSVVSHDLRGPLAIADGNLALARTACANGHVDEVTDRLGAVAQAHDRMSDLIDDLLTVARQGTRVETLEPVDVDAIAMGSWAFVDSGEATIDIDVGRRIRADESRLRQFFENLFRNAVEHGSTADATVESSGRSELGAGVHIRVSLLDDGDGFFVEDDGPGIAPDIRETVFEGGYSTKPNGTGFGLMILREIAEAHGWEVTVTDGEMGGARFEVRNVQVVAD